MLPEPSIEEHVVLAETFKRPHSRMTARERLAETIVGGGFVVAAVLLWLRAPPAHFAAGPALVCLLVLVVACVFASTHRSASPCHAARVRAAAVRVPIALVPLAVVARDGARAGPRHLRAATSARAGCAGGRQLVVRDRPGRGVRDRARRARRRRHRTAARRARRAVRRRLRGLGARFAFARGARLAEQMRETGSTSSTPRCRAWPCPSPSRSSAPRSLRSRPCPCSGSSRCSPASATSACKA